jgi:hypothetical protein
MKQLHVSTSGHASTPLQQHTGLSRAPAIRHAGPGLCILALSAPLQEGWAVQALFLPPSPKRTSAGRLGCPGCVLGLLR